MATYASFEKVSSQLRLPPHSIEVEQALLGSLMMQDKAWQRCDDVLKTEHFFEDLHRQIFEAAFPILERGIAASPMVIKAALGDPAIDKQGTKLMAYLQRMCAEPGPLAHVRTNAMMLANLYDRRRFMALMDDIRETTYSSPLTESVVAHVAKLDLGLTDLVRERGEDGAFISFDEASDLAVDTACAAYRKGTGVCGLSTGLPRLDDALGGLVPSDLLIVAGRPGSGKTALASNIAFEVARNLKHQRQSGERTGTVGFFSLEMSQAQLAARILSQVSGVEGWKIRKGLTTQQELEAYVDACRELRGLPISINDKGGITIQTLIRKARQLHRVEGLKLLIVDYLQLLSSATQSNRGNRVQEVTEITTGLKALAKDLHIPVIALSQLSRQVESRDNKRPFLSDLRESGSIEQDADVVMFVYREEYYLTKSEPRKGTQAYLEWERALWASKGTCEIIVGKNRHGPEGTVELGFQAATTRFLPEPEERGELCVEPPSREKKPSLGKQSIEAIGILRSLNITAAVENTGMLGNVPRGVRPVPYLLWKEQCVEQLLDVDRSPAAGSTLMEKIIPDLKAAGYIGRGGSSTEPYVWLTEKGQG